MNPFNKKFFRQGTKRMSKADIKEIDNWYLTSRILHPKFLELRVYPDFAKKYIEGSPATYTEMGKKTGFIRRVRTASKPNKIKDLIYLTKYKKEPHFDLDIIHHELAHAKQFDINPNISEKEAERQAWHFSDRMSKRYHQLKDVDTKYLEKLYLQKKLANYKPTAFDELKNKKLSESMKSIEVI